MPADAGNGAPMAPVAEATLGERYRLVRRIGAGGMGSVWEADDLRLDRPVAVKLPAVGPADREHLRRFAREANAAARLNHPNVASVLDYGEDGEVPFLVLELLDGETLAERVRRGPVPAGEVVAIVEGIAAALDAAHAAGVVHRDVKPANVMLTSSGVKVLDFGAASASWSPTITTAGIVGTAAYLSPEQAAGQAAVAQSDVYALGVVAYELLTGRAPFVADNPAAVVAAHLHRAPPPVLEAAPGTPGHVAEAVERALAKDPAQRPPTASAFARLLRDPGAARAGVAQAQVIADPATERLPLVGAPAAARRSTGTPARRGRWSWLGGAALLLVVLSVLASTRGGGDDPGRTETTVAEATVPDVTVPGVVGQPVEPAMAALADAGLQVADVVLGDGPRDTVVAVDPRVGATVEPGSAVTLTVGAGSDDGADEDDGGGEGDEDERRGNGNGNGPPSCDTRPDHPSCD